MNAEQIMQEAKKYEEKIIAHRRYLHQCPGTGFDLDDTVAYVKAELTAMGYTPQDCGKAGVVALAGGKKPGKVFLLRADMDALPIKEEADIDYQSQNGNMHACGHDMHTAMLLGAAQILKDHEDELEGTVKLMFQPAEEIFEGAHDMIEAGVLENPKVDAAFMIHVASTAPLPPGTAMLFDGGVAMPAVDPFEIRIQGKGCHGAMPEAGIDPINVAAHIIISLQEIISREIAMGDAEVLTIGMVQAGYANNVIPDSAKLGGTIRSMDEEKRAFVKTRLQEIVEGVAKTFRAEAEVIFATGCPTLQIDNETSVSVTNYAKELLGKFGAFTFGEMAAMSGKKQTVSGSEDFAYVSQKVPAIALNLAAGQPDKGYTFPQHHPKAKFDVEALAKGSALYAYAAMRWLEEHK